jgi:hypothetical protein
VLDVARLLGVHLGVRDGVAGLLELRLDLDLLRGTRSELGGRALTDGLICRELLGQGVAPERNGVGAALERGRRALRACGQLAAACATRAQAFEPLLAVRACVLRALGDPALGSEVRLDPRALHGRLALLRRCAAKLDAARGAA